MLVLVLVLMTLSSRVSSRVDFLHQIFTPCIFALLSLLHKSTIVLLYPRLQIVLSLYSTNSTIQMHNLKPDLFSKHPRLSFILAPARPLLKLPHRSRTLSSL